MGYDPNAAPDPTPREFKNFLKCVMNELITVAEAHERKRFRDMPEGADVTAPYWDLMYEALDARLMPDNILLPISGGTKLFDKDGKRLDNTQRPFRFSSAFNAFGISVFPGDPDGKFDAWCSSNGQDAIGTNPSYDASKVVGRIFLCIMKKAEDLGTVGKPLPIPLTAEPETFTFTGTVRNIQRKTDGETGADGTVQPAQVTTVDIRTDEAARAQVVQALVGASEDADLFDVLRAAGVPNSFMVDGQSALAVAANGGLVEALDGAVTIVDGKLAIPA